MKDYEKLALAVGGGALAIAAYQAYKTKQAADATVATDPSRNPVTAAIDLGQNVVGGTYDWFMGKFDNATGRAKGRADQVIDTIKAVPSGVSYWTTKATDLGKDVAEAGTKYVWSIGAKTAASGKESIEYLTNKPFTLMGSVRTMYDAARTVPKSSMNIANIISGVGSKLEKTTRSTATTFKGVVGGFWHKVTGR